jgi:uncharacterized protein (TIGR00299 family) protein
MPLSGNRILVFDPQASGISGDMIVGALLDIGADTTSVLEAMHTPRHFLSDCHELEVIVKDIVLRGVRAKRVTVNIKEDMSHRSSQDLITALSACIDRISISEEASRYAHDTLNTLVSAEASIHSENPQDIHLHETASADTLADIIGTAAALDDLSLFTETTIYSTPVAIGGGLFNFSHGTASSPAPATLEILRSREFPCHGGPVAAELATPTGVSLLTCLVHEPVEFYPPMKPSRVGYGAGARDFTEMPNVLRVTCGESLFTGLTRDNVYVIETNLDDVSGETIGYTIQRLLSEGAKDAVAVPSFNKKGRPGHVIQVITDSSNIERLCGILIYETGSLGVRIHTCERRILTRESVPIEVTVGDISKHISVKIARATGGQIVRIKAEYEDIKSLAEQTGKTFRELEDLVEGKAWDSCR